ncbi:MAG: methyltransferase domain-containing protein [Leptolyngbyaceae cyanobacterium bins.59]|nr:methyltransferase domain-containing protein [Leptolyngbyaceae cyanobacterium bins.59]
MNGSIRKVRLFIKQILGHLDASWNAEPTELFPLTPALPLPPGISEPELREILESIAFFPEMVNYCRQDFRRFVYTYGLVKDMTGKCLELGSNPYFTTLLLKYYTSLDLTLANYFSPDYELDPITKTEVVELSCLNPQTRQPQTLSFKSHHFNLETEQAPFDDGEFDVILYCEILEHLTLDPLKSLREIKRILKPGGTLVLTTPNAIRLENVARLIVGENIYDTYSAYGIYGRHNREYTSRELRSMLSYMGFTIDTLFTADVSPNQAKHLTSVYYLQSFINHRKTDLGQYIFIKATKTGEAGAKRLPFLYRSYALEEMETSTQSF